MKYSPEFIRELLYQTEPLQAIYELAQIWSAREGVSENRSYFGFSQIEFRVHVLLFYQGEVGNGGHSQFFFNPFGRYASAVGEALDALAFEPFTDLFKRACSVFPGSVVPEAHDRRQAFIEQLSPEAKLLLRTLDQEFYTLDRDFHARLLDYLRQNAAQVLQPEQS